MNYISISNTSDSKITPKISYLRGFSNFQSERVPIKEEFLDSLANTIFYSTTMEIFNTISSAETDTNIIPNVASEELTNILFKYDLDLSDEESLNNFSESLKSLIQKYEHNAIKILYVYLSSEILNDHQKAEILTLLGDVNSPTTRIIREWILEHFLQSESPKIRYGTVMGISNLNSQNAISSLEKALKREQYLSLENALKIVIEQIRLTS